MNTPSQETPQENPTLFVYCPHCFERVLAAEASAGAVVPCPVCARDLASQEMVPLADYVMHPQLEKAHETKEIQEYVHSLEEHARIELARPPYHRKRFPVDLLAGLILMGCGFWLLTTALTGDSGLLVAFINIILPAVMLILLGVICLVFWAK